MAAVAPDPWISAIVHPAPAVTGSIALHVIEPPQPIASPEVLAVGRLVAAVSSTCKDSPRMNVKPWNTPLRNSLATEGLAPQVVAESQPSHFPQMMPQRGHFLSVPTLASE